MRRAFTTREKVLLVVLAVLVIGIGYFKLLLEPINDKIADYQADMTAEQDEILQNTAVLMQMQQMQTELEELHAAGGVKPLPSYDNSDALLVELNTVLGRSRDYSLNFGAVAPLEDSAYIMRRPLSLTFSTDTYAQARSILDDLHDSDNINQISDCSISFQKDNTVSVTLTIAYFELVG